MSFYHGKQDLSRRFRLVLLSMLQTQGLPFADVLPESDIQDAFDAHGIGFVEVAEEDEKDRVYTPPITLWAFLSQVLHKQEQRSCLAAVSRVAVLLVALGRDACAKNSGAYCRARAKLSETVIEHLTLEVAEGCESSIPKQWLWHGRHVKLVDGTTVSMPDTQENQDAYPQQSGQKEGLGFPIARMVVLVSLATAMVSGVALGQYSGKETGETALIRQLLGQLHRNDILLADRYYCSYFMVALLREMGVDFVSRLHQSRQTDICRRQRLGKHDYLVTWKRPKKPAWMDQQTYEQMPESLSLRQVEVKVSEPGFRVESLTVVTTLTDVKKYTRDDLAELFHKRWLVELDIASIKITLRMDVLRCKTPEMIHKEIWTCLLAYNLIRKTMLQAAKRNKLSPRQLSFATAIQTLAASWMVLPTQDQSTQWVLIEAQIDSLACQLVGNRPNRVEPRAVKRRPKTQRLLTMPRQEARDLLLSGVDPYRKQK